MARPPKDDPTGETAKSKPREYESTSALWRALDKAGLAIEEAPAATPEAKPEPVAYNPYDNAPAKNKKPP